MANRRQHWRFWRRPPEQRVRQQAAQQMYCELVNRARQPVFFLHLGVPDTPEGRFEMVGLHGAVMIRQLRRAGDPGTMLAQDLFDLMFADMDESLRQLGVGDLSVGKHVKRLAGSFYARLAAVDQALGSIEADSGDPHRADVLSRMLITNVYHGGPAPAPDQLHRLAAYVVGLDRTLAALTPAQLLTGEIPPFASASPGQERD